MRRVSVSLNDEIAGTCGGDMKLWIWLSVIKRFQFLLESAWSNIEVANDVAG